MDNDLIGKFKYELSSLGIETLGRYYSTYPAKVVNYYPEIDRVDLFIPGLIDGLEYLASVPIKKDTNLNIPFQKGDEMSVTFMFGLITMPLAEFAYHSYDTDTGATSKDVELASDKYYKLYTPNGLKIEEIEKGFQIVKGKLSLIFTEDEIKIKTSRGSVVIDGDFTIDMDSGGEVKMNSTTGNTLININSLVSYMNQLATVIQSHGHAVSGAIASPPTIYVPRLFNSSISIKNIKGG